MKKSKAENPTGNSVILLIKFNLSDKEGIGLKFKCKTNITLWKKLYLYIKVLVTLLRISNNKSLLLQTLNQRYCKQLININALNKSILLKQ